MYVNFILEIDKKLDYRKIFIFFEVAQIGLIIPSSQGSGISPVSKIRLKNNTYMGNILPELYLRYSFSILSFAELLLFLSHFIHLRISLSVIWTN